MVDKTYSEGSPAPSAVAFTIASTSGDLGKAWQIATQSCQSVKIYNGKKRLQCCCSTRILLAGTCAGRNGVSGSGDAVSACHTSTAGHVHSQLRSEQMSEPDCIGLSHEHQWLLQINDMQMQAAPACAEQTRAQLGPDHSAEALYPVTHISQQLQVQHVFQRYTAL